MDLSGAMSLTTADKFKVGDKVRFKSPNSRNAIYFKKGLRNLTIIEPNIGSKSYRVDESDNSATWHVDEAELEMETIDNWRETIEC